MTAKKPWCCGTGNTTRNGCNTSPAESSRNACSITGISSRICNTLRTSSSARNITPAKWRFGFGASPVFFLRVEFELQPTLRGDLLELRPLRPADFDALFDAASDPLIWEQHPESDRY